MEFLASPMAPGAAKLRWSKNNAAARELGLALGFACPAALIAAMFGSMATCAQYPRLFEAVCCFGRGRAFVLSAYAYIKEEAAM